MHPSAWRNCLENSLRHLERASVATRCTRMGTPSTLLGRSRTPIRDLSRISKQFRNMNSRKFAVSSPPLTPVLCGRASYVGGQRLVADNNYRKSYGHPLGQSHRTGPIWLLRSRLTSEPRPLRSALPTRKNASENNK